ncbi:MAG: formate dehydrogenase accessory sulfurtransferase FdhD [Armatimonadota bacterium]|nr:formate dehydrogenase accessory sulfurtransferase FdhD [Armatimonadota bacterium]MDR7444672.1 formate dehydrogenase accessory sulfurtransferase FdhD [Armatimonadota bacterium]MDR7571049.1 formate dehydrogenase accessory sulfurtransferase FdhD [Armatimonadota bacterium]MDR7613619.1 formate dehydrogenase accessory sulfurtransferase FdhD [Armatimonadota bacterium]
MGGGRPASKVRTQVRVVRGDRVEVRGDLLATEEPMEIRLVAGSHRKTVAVTMRTPGHDFELAAGFLFTEGIVTHREEIARISYCVDPDLDPEQRYNVVNVELRTDALPELPSLERHFYTTSACGVCGKASLEALRLRGCQVGPGPAVEAAVLRGLPEQLRAAQSLFALTGGLHAAALFEGGGRLLALREDVGRHNAMDKLLGWAFLEGKLPLGEHIVLVSGRASFELVQKAVVAGIPIFCAVSAPSSLAAEVARAFGVTLVGFLREDRFNVYSGAERVRIPAPLG